MRLIGCVLIRSSTSVRSASGSTPTRLQLAHRLIKIAAVRPLRSLPTKSQLLRLCRARHKRKNWLFAGSDNGGRTAAVLMSLCTTCRDLGVDPFVYLRDVLERVSTHPMSWIEELLPDRWTPAESPDPTGRKGGLSINPKLILPDGHDS